MGLVKLTKGMIPLLKKSADGRIISVTSRAGSFQQFSEELQKKLLTPNSLQDLIEIGDLFEKTSVSGEYLKHGFSTGLGNPAYAVSKSLVTSYTILLGKLHPELLSTCTCPGPIDTDMTKQANLPFQLASTQVGADTPYMLATESRDKIVSGAFYCEREIVSPINPSFPKWATAKN